MPMDSQRYNIIFEGKIADGVDMEIAKGNLQRLFKADRATVDKLFSGKRTILKKDIPANAVKKYQAALTNAGVECTTDPDLSSAAAAVEPGQSPAIAPTKLARKYGNVVGGGAAMMIVAAVVFIAIIGILTAIAIPQYNDYVQRSKVWQSIDAVQPALDKIAEFGKREKYFPNSNTEARLVDDVSGESVTSLAVSENGVITLTFGSENNLLLDGKTLLYVPSLANNTVQWDCSGGTLSRQLRPKQCHDGDYSGQQVVVNRQWVIADDNVTRMRVPTSWKKHPELNDTAGMEYANLPREQYLIVTSDSKAHFTSSADVFGYNVYLERNLRNSVENLQVKYLGEVKINGMIGLKYEIRGEVDNIKIVYLQVALEGENHFHQLLFWTVPTRWRANLQSFEEALVSFTECPGGCSGS